MSKFFQALEKAEQDRALRPDVGRRVEAERSGWEAPDFTLSPTRSGETTVRRDVASREQNATGIDDEGLEEHLVSLLSPSSFEAEQYRTLSHLVERLRMTNAVAVLGISSAGDGEGKTVTAVNLAGALAQDLRNRVLLLEADLRRPTLAKYLGLSDSEQGLSQALVRPGLGLIEATTSLREAGFDVFVAGHPSANPYETLKSARVEELFQEARKHYDYVIVDTPPLIGLPEVRVIEKLIDGLFVVVRAHRTSRPLLEEALRQIDPTKVIGVVFNEDDQLRSGHGRYYARRNGGHA